MAEPTKMPFGVWTWEGPGNYGLGGGAQTPKRRGSFEGISLPNENYRKCPATAKVTR